MGFDLNQDLTDGVWVEYDTDVSFKIRYLMPEKMDEIRNRCAKKKWRQGQQVTETDDKRLNEMLADYVIEDWKGISENGNMASCTPPNKIRLIGKSIEISNFIFGIAGDIANFEKQKREIELKNSESSSPTH
jgi:hypothetical protein